MPGKPKRSRRRVRGKIKARTIRFAGGAGSAQIAAAQQGAAAEAPPRFQMVAYTGVAFRPSGWYEDEPLVLDLAGLEVGRKSRPILKDHDPAQVVGHSDAIENTGRALHISGPVSGAGEAAREVLESSRNGFPWQASVGVFAGDIEWVAQGQKVRVNGRDMVGPLAIARRGLLNESSFVALGADDDTVAFAASKGVGAMTFKEWLAAKGFDEATLTKAQRTTLLNAYNAEQDASDDDEGEGEGDDDADAQGDERDEGGDEGDEGGNDDPQGDANANASRGRGGRGRRSVQGRAGNGRRVSATVAELRREEVAETARIQRIRSVCRGHPSIEAMAIDQGWSVDRAELQVLRASRPNAPGVRGSSGDAPAAAIEIALARSVGVSDRVLQAQYGERDLEAADRAGLRRIGLSGLFMEAARQAGNSVGLNGLQDSHIEAALHNARFVSASGAASTVSVPVLLSNVANLVLLDGYQSVEDITPQIASEDSVNDFKEVKSVRVTTHSAFEEVGSDGELRDAELSEQDYANRAKTFGTQLTLSRQMIINDSLGAFMRVLGQMGQRGMAKKNRVAIAALLGAPTGASATDFFRTNVNWFAGADTALGIDSLSRAERAFFERLDSTSEPILTKPSVLLVSPKYKTRAETIYKSEKIASVEESMTPEANPHAGKFTTVCSPYLASVVGLHANDDLWYLLSNPRGVSAIQIVFLRGQKAPMVRSAVAPPGRLGVTFEVVFDFGVALQDSTAIVGMKGIV